MEKNNLEKIKKITEDFFQKGTFSGAIKAEEGEEGTVFLTFKTDEPQILIGQKGETLLEIQHLLRRLIVKKIGEPVLVDFDINDYKKKKSDYLKSLARSTADEVSLSKKEETLPPLPAYERRIIHLELKNRDDVITESAGEEPNRKIIIKPSQ